MDVELASTNEIEIHSVNKLFCDVTFSPVLLQVVTLTNDYYAIFYLCVLKISFRKVIHAE